MEAVRSALGEDFEVLRPLGRGTVATVYLARDRALGVQVAIKVLNAAKAADEVAGRRFEREARAAASLADHPNTVAVSRFGRLPEGIPYLVMPYVKGRTIEERLKAEGHLGVDEAVRILGEVASALALAHEKGIVHRDVRPGNVLWDEDKGRARLTDFGIAAVLDPTGAETTRLTRTGQILGDARYLSPEQLRDQEITELADMYLFGVLGYEILSGHSPYTVRTPTEWIMAHLNKEPRPLRELRADVPAHVADLLGRCLAKEPKHRPSAADVVRILADGEAGAAAPERHGESADLQALIRKRVPQIVLLTAGGGITLIGLADALGDLLPENAMLVTVVFVVAAIASSAVIAWFHGEKGRQRAPAIEYALLGFVGLVWLAVTGWVVWR